MSGSISGSDGGSGGNYDYSAAGQPNMNGVTMIVPVSGTTTVQASNQMFVVADAGMSGTTGSTLNVVGGNNQFVIALSRASEANNKINVNGGNNQFVVKVGPSGSGDASSQGGNTVDINGGNSQFAVIYDYSSFSSGTPSGNNVSINGGNNSFVISYHYADTSGTSASAVPGGGMDGSAGLGGSLLNSGSGNNNQSVITPANAPVTVGDGVASTDSATNMAGDNVSVGGGNNQFVVSSQNDGTGPTVSIDGNNNAFVVAASTGSSAPYAGLTGGSPFGGAGGSPFGSMAGGTSDTPSNAGGSTTGANISNTGSIDMSGSIANSSDISSLLAASPFGPLLNLPGVTAQTIFGNAGLPSQGSSSSDASGGAMSNSPYASLAGVIGAASSSAGGALGGASSGAGGAFGGASSGNPFASQGGSSGAASGDTSSGSSSADLTALLKQSPFGRLFDLPGVTPETLFGNLGGSSGGAGSSMSGSNPFGSGAAIGSNPFTNYPGTSSIFSASDPTATGTIPTA